MVPQSKNYVRKNDAYVRIQIRHLNKTEYKILIDWATVSLQIV